MWQYFAIHPDILGCDWRRDEGTDAFNLVIKRRSSKPEMQGIFYTFPDSKKIPVHPNFFVYVP